MRDNKWMRSLCAVQRVVFLKCPLMNASDTARDSLGLPRGYPSGVIRASLTKQNDKSICFVAMTLRQLVGLVVYVFLRFVITITIVQSLLMLSVEISLK